MRIVGFALLSTLLFLPSCLTKDERVDGVREMRAKVSRAILIGCGDGFDQDRDGILTGEDNCPRLANAGQTDADGNGVGDECEDDDIDNDGRPNAEDNCPEWPNTDQNNRNLNLCDPTIDRDGDELADNVDICPRVHNPGQAEGAVALQFDYEYILIINIYPGGQFNFLPPIM